jgi:ribonuclease T2
MRRTCWRIVLCLLLLAGSWGEARAFEPMSGCFVADAACPAPPSLRHDSNPGDVATEPGRAYPVLGANRKDQASHLQIRVPLAVPSDRWVAVGCGHRVEACGGEATAPAAVDYLLAASWQPAFCEAHRGTPECRSQTASRFDASHFTLHGLWLEPPSNVYCGVDRSLRSADEAGRWRDLPPVDLTGSTRAELETAMPGTRSGLERHEWLKHGTCADTAPEVYFTAALALLDQLNASPVHDLVAARIGRHLSASELRAAFEEGFGPGAGARVELACDEGLIAELRLHLRGAIGPTAPLGDLLAAAPATRAGCRGGLIAPPGLSR